MTFFRAIHMVGLGSESVIQSWLSPGSMEVSLLRIPKSIRFGFLDRLRALERHVDGVEATLREAISRYGSKTLVADDVLDALVLAYLSSLGAKALSTLPPKPPKDGCGLPMELVYLEQKLIH